MSVPTMYRHANTVYFSMSEQSTEKEIKGVTVQVWRGSITDLFRGTGISWSFYQGVMDGLERCGSIARTKRGNAGVPSEFVLHHPPDLGDWPVTEGLTKHVDDDMLKAQVEDLAKRLGGIDIVEAFTDLESRLTECEERLGIDGKSK